MCEPHRTCLVVINHVYGGFDCWISYWVSFNIDTAEIYDVAKCVPPLCAPGDCFESKSVPCRVVNFVFVIGKDDDDGEGALKEVSERALREVADEAKCVCLCVKRKTSFTFGYQDARDVVTQNVERMRHHDQSTSAGV